MEGQHHRSVGRAVVVAVGVGYAVAASGTTPFTWPADVVTALPIALLAAAVVVRWPARPRRDRPGTERPFLAWGLLLAAVVALELGEYLAPGSRGAHPTLSSMADAVDRHRVLKAAAFFGWLALGAAIVVSGLSGQSGEGHRGSRGAP